MIAHEFTHYLQKNTNPTSILQLPWMTEKQYYSQIWELEALSVEAYYFLKSTKNEELKNIITSKQKVKRKMEMLCNAYYKVAYPWKYPLF